MFGDLNDIPVESGYTPSDAELRIIALKQAIGFTVSSEDSFTDYETAKVARTFYNFLKGNI